MAQYGVGMMLFTKHERKLDYKGRLAIPDDLLRTSGQDWKTVVVLKNTAVAPGDQKVSLLSLYDSTTWDLYLQTAFKRLEDVDEARLFMDRVVGDAATLGLDVMNRLTLPASLLHHAGIEKVAIVTGIFDHVEVWNPATYESYIDALADEVTVPSLADLARSRIHEVPAQEMLRAE